MKQVYIVHENHPKLLLLFAGWAADETPFKQYRPKGMTTKHSILISPFSTATSV